jgi:hypothetical protein
MAKYKTGGWFKQSIRHSNARKKGHAGGKYSEHSTGTLHFKNKEAYNKWLAHGHIHKEFAKVKGYKKIIIAGKPHKVEHNKKYGYAEKGFQTFPINKDYEIIAHWEKTRNGFRHIAILMKNGQEIDKATANYLNRTWESFEYESVISRLLDKAKIMTDAEKKSYLQALQMGEVLTSSKKESNDWKERMIKAGLPQIDIPEDWDTLSEDEKEARLNKVIEYMKKK